MLEPTKCSGRAEKLAEYVARKLAEAPPITAAQRDRIAVLLRGGAK